ncbi:PAS domain-containing protein [Lentibacillus cibarius]|uniref:histidine kinase n=1 Tax=Lentibacillus cibarius TaxID=2583219 RepID=A0A5S3QLR6_9BACI|nr:PAS domain S-box protein [Lentibacillus cibarius]TMN21426.1 PAS domain S-box protein [Lentibacillus cibarius]
MHHLMETLLKSVLMDGITDMVFVMRVKNGSEFIYEFINKAAEEGTGIGLQDTGKTIADVCEPEHAALLYAHYQKVVDTGESVSFDDSYLASEENYYMNTKLTPLFNADDQCTHVVAVVKDITDAIIAQKQLKEREERFRTIAEYANDLITMVNDKGEIVYASPSFQTILGHDHQEYEGKFFLHNVHPDDRDEMDRKMIESIKHGQPFTATCRQFDAENNAVWCQSHGTSVYDSEGKFQYMVIITRDVS